MDQNEAIQKAREFARTAYAGQVNAISHASQQKIQEMRAQLAARGTILSGTQVVETARINGEMIRALTVARLDAILEGFELYRVTIDDLMAVNICDEVVQEMNEMIHSSKGDTLVGLPALTTSQYPGLLAKEVGISAAWVQAQIDRRRLTQKKAVGRKKKSMDVMRMAAWAGIIAVPIAILAIPPVTDFVFHKLLHIGDIVPPTPEPKPDPGPPLLTFTPPDLEGHKWDVHIRASGSPAFEGQTQTPFLADNTYVILGKFLVPTQAVDQHIDCPATVNGHWRYANANHSQLKFDMKIEAVAGRTRDEFLQCSQTLSPLQQAQKEVSETCTFTSPELCTSNSLEIHLVALP